LASVRVLDVGGADSDAVSRLFGDLGADVLKIEPPGGAADRVDGGWGRGGVRVAQRR
jgi:crotonobetainyl-CoA:carnitine CoA-transferase CaiB-like acyl-CoA transferase